MAYEFSKIVKLVVCCIVSLCVCVPHVEASIRIKDIAYFQGARDNTIMGYGLVVGLNGTGDNSQSVFTVKSIASMLSRMGIEVSSSDISPQNVAAVMVTATLPPFVKSGARLDVTLSSLGDADSLKGGTLLLTPLKGADGNVYAVAQGHVALGMDTGTRTSGFSTVARIPNGALVEREVPVQLLHDGTVNLLLHNVDFTTCVRVAEGVNVAFNASIAKAIDGAMVSIQVPEVYRTSLVPFLARIEKTMIDPDVRAKIIVNEKTGTIVGGVDVKVSQVSITHKNITIKVSPDMIEAQSDDEVVAVPARKSTSLIVQDEIFMEGGGAVQNDHVAEEFVSIGAVAKTLSGMGITPGDMVAILQAMKEAGAIQADIQVI